MRVNKASKSGKPVNHIRQGKNNQSRQGYVEKLDRSNSSQLRADENEASRLMSIDIVYDKLQNMREEYKHFYSEEQNFEEAWSSLLEDPEHFIEHLIEIFEAHNHVVDALNEFDKIFETNHIDTLTEFIKHYETEFHAISILIQPDSSLRVRNRKLRDHFNKKPEAFTFLTKPGGFLRKLYDFYHNLKAIKPPTTQDEDQLAWYQGLFMDQKA